MECQVGCCIKCFFFLFVFVVVGFFFFRNFSHRIRGWGVAHSASLQPGDALCISNLLFSMWCLFVFVRAYTVLLFDVVSMPYFHTFASDYLHFAAKGLYVTPFTENTQPGGSIELLNYSGFRLKS